MGWQQCVGSLNCQVFFGKEPYFGRVLILVRTTWQVREPSNRCQAIDPYISICISLVLYFWQVVFYVAYYRARHCSQRKSDIFEFHAALHAQLKHKNHIKKEIQPAIHAIYSAAAPLPPKNQKNEIKCNLSCKCTQRYAHTKTKKNKKKCHLIFKCTQRREYI